jgi:hypothetical protein
MRYIGPAIKRADPPAGGPCEIPGNLHISYISQGLPAGETCYLALPCYHTNFIFKYKLNKIQGIGD